MEIHTLCCFIALFIVRSLYSIPVSNGTEFAFNSEYFNSVFNNNSNTSIKIQEYDAELPTTVVPPPPASNAIILSQEQSQPFNAGLKDVQPYLPLVQTLPPASQTTTSSPSHKMIFTSSNSSQDDDLAHGLFHDNPAMRAHFKLSSGSTVNTDVSQLLPIIKGVVPRIAQEYSTSTADFDPQHTSLCVKAKKCERLQYSECLGATLPYTHTSLQLTRLHSQRSAMTELTSWANSLRQLPRCWAVVRPYLCSVFFPPCDDSMLHLPPQDLCEAIRRPCELVKEGRGWPSFLTCEGLMIQGSESALDVRGKKEAVTSALQLCPIGNSLHEVKFNSSSGTCVAPLVPSPRQEAWYPGVKGCALPCQNTHFDRQETAGFHSFVGIMAGLSVACCAFNVLSYLLEWRCGGSARYPSVVLLYVCGCCLVAGVALLVQYHGNVRQHTTCHADGTLRTHEPSTEGNLSCVAVFVCLYYFGLAAAVWLVILSYCWYNYFRTVVLGDAGRGAGGAASGASERGAAYFHLLAWSLPLVLTITTLALGQVSADSLHGVCFLSTDLSVRVPLLLIPLVVVSSLSSLFLVRGLILLCQLKLKCGDRTVCEYIIRLTALLLALLFCTAGTLYCHAHYYYNEGQWHAAFKNSILCRLKLIASTGEDGCSPSSRPSLSVYNLQVLAWSIPAIILTSFSWTANTGVIWCTCLARVMGVDRSKQALYDGRQQLHGAPACQSGYCCHLSLPPPNNNVGLAETQLWSRADEGGAGLLTQRKADDVIHGVARGGRGAIAVTAAASDTEHSISSSRHSTESGLRFYSSKRQQLKHRIRRHSLDSQLSFHISDVEREAARHTMLKFGGGNEHHRASVHSYSSRTSRLSRTEWLGKKVTSKRGYDSRRASFTSEDSSFSSVLVTTTGIATNQDTLFSNMMKRLQLSSSAASTPQPPNVPSLAAHHPQVEGRRIVPYHSATVGVQTSLEADDLMPFPPAVSDKSVQVTTPLLQRASQRAGGRASLSSSESEEDSRHTSRKHKRRIIENNIHDSREKESKHDTLANLNANKHERTSPSLMTIISPSKKEKRTSKHKSDKSGSSNKQHASRRRKRKGNGERALSHSRGGEVAETSFTAAAGPFGYNGSTDYLLSRTMTPRIPSVGSQRTSPDDRVGPRVGMDGRLSSAMGGSRGTFIDTGTISTILDMDALSDSNC